jgi:hypothetical protein
VWTLDLAKDIDRKRSVVNVAISSKLHIKRRVSLLVD